MAEENRSQPIEKWTEADVSTWLKTIGVKENYIQKIHEEEVDGLVLLGLTENYLKKEIGMKSGPAHLIIQKRNELIESLQLHKPQKGLNKMQSGNQNEQPRRDNTDPVAGTLKQVPPDEDTQSYPRQPENVLCIKRDCKPRPFGKKGIDFTYLKHSVLQPESGVSDLISPCHEYKSFAIAASLDRTRLQAKFAREVFKFGSACMNIRSNATIHFGVMDSKGNTGCVHGEIIGIPVKEKDMYTDALDYIRKSFRDSDSEHVRLCIREPEFIKVVDDTEECYVVEVDIVPEISIVKNKVYSVRLPNFKEASNKVEFEKETIYRRNGPNSEPVSDLNDFYQRVKDRDAKREEAEQSVWLSAPYLSEDLGRKLKMLVSDGKKVLDKEKWYILVTNKFEKEHLSSINFLLNMKIFCVFDFDPDSKISGLCSKYLDHHEANLHFLQSYKIPSEMNISAFESHLHLFEQASWIFCNGRRDYRGNETPCDEMTWIKTKKTLLKEAVTVICKQILPQGTFLVIFLLISPVDLPIVHTFYEFFAELQGHEDIICISESEENHSRWTGLAQVSCSLETLNCKSVAGMKLSHVNETIQSIQPLAATASKHLSVFIKGLCLLETIEEERMSSLEIVCADQCDNASDDTEVAKEKENIEKQFYHGGRVSWMNFWLAEKKMIGELIQRDTFKDISKLLNETPRWSSDQIPVNIINIYHHPGSGGSTIARQVLWNNRKELRCAVVKPSFSAATVAEHAVKLREYEEKDPQKCLPVLLLVEDCEKEYLDDLRYELEVAMKTKKINQGTLCFVLLSCRQSRDPEKMCKESPLQNFPVTHKLSPDEKRHFAQKLTELEQRYEPEHILTFVLMSKEFHREYIIKFVRDLLEGINHSSVSTRLILYVALLNTHVQKSYLSQSHCEALLQLTLHMNKLEDVSNERNSSGRFRRHLFESSLSEQAKLLFVHLRNEKTNIQSIQVIHPLVAEEVLHQLLGHHQQQSRIAIDLLRENVLFENSFGKGEYHRFLRDLCMRRNKIIRGDKSDSSFSPLIEHVLEKENKENAIEILKEAYLRFGSDAFFAQQLARLHYTYEMFEEAKHWAEVAEKKMPNNSFILDTKGQVYKRWFNAKCKLLKKVNVMAENTVDAIATAIEALECFRACEAAANSEQESLNNSGYFSEVDLTFDVLKLIFQVFPAGDKGHAECLQYLTTGYIPEAVEKPWAPFHSKLKCIHKNMCEALERISEDLTHFQTVTTAEDESLTSEMKINNPIRWLAKRSSCYGTFFREAPLDAIGQSQLLMRMNIFSLGGGNMTTVFSLLSEKKPAALEQIIDVYSGCKNKLDQMELVIYIASQIALGCLSPTSSKLETLKELRELSQQFRKERGRYLPNALFLQTLVFWPDVDDNKRDRDANYEIVMSAVDDLRRSYSIKMKRVPQKEKRIFTHFFLGNGNGLAKIVHKSKIEMLTKLLTMSERRMKWLSGDVWKMPEIAMLLKRVQGWTEDGKVYIRSSEDKPLMICALNSDSVPYGNENVEFYLGFTFQGPVAHGITVSKSK